MSYQLLFLAAAGAARLIYVGYVGFALKRQEWQPTLSWDRFRRRAAWVMNLDTAAFMIAVIATAGELTWPPFGWAMGIGIVLAVIGLAVKYSAFKVLGKEGYYWADFFRQDEAPAAAAVKKGIYKYLSNPMYTAGYLHAYGWALMWLSWKGLLLAAFYQAAILTFYFVVERPHFLKVYKKVEESLKKD